MAPTPPSPYLLRMPDGTVKQRNPFTGTQVWTVPGRGTRPLGIAAPQQPLDPAQDGHHCAFCCGRYLETPPERSRVVREGWRRLDAVPAAHLFDTVAQFRRIPNLFEILSFDYWRTNHGVTLSDAQTRRRDAYLADPAGRAHLLAVCRAKALAAGLPLQAWDALSEHERLAGIDAFFGGGHDVIVARRHVTDGGELASSGTLTPDEHRAFVRLTIDAMADLYAANPHVRYVAAFQNWLKPAGASFDHLHKQLVAINEHGTQIEQELAAVRADPHLYRRAAIEHAAQQGLLVAQNEHAVAFAGFGHRYPTLEVFSTAPPALPFEHSPAQQDAVSDLLHALHAATGPTVPTNEEWHHRPVDVDVPMPWRVMLKWRVSVPAGFEGGTKIYVNTIDPWSLRDRVLPRLHELRDTGALAHGIRLGTECAAP